MNTKAALFFSSVVLAGLALLVNVPHFAYAPVVMKLLVKQTYTPTRTVAWTPSPTSSYTPSPVLSLTASDTSTVTETPSETPTPTITLTPSNTPSVTYTPHVDSVMCANHDTHTFHTLWDSVNDCHFDHEHGTNPFVPGVSDDFPGFYLYALLGGVEVGHTNPSSPMENTHKHGGFKWNVQLHHPQTCAGYEGAVTGVDGSVIQFHGFGDYAIEAEARFHSTVALLRQCRASNPTDYGYVFVNQLQDYGQRIVPYQGTIYPYSNQPSPGFPSSNGPYLSIDCLDLTSPHVLQCRESLAQALLFPANSIWTSKPTGAGTSTTPPLFKLLWRVRDTYRLIDWNDQVYPFNFFWLCSDDNGATYNPTNCRYNNTTTQVHEVAGTIPDAWDNLAGWDSNPSSGRITAQGFVDGSGNINAACSESGGDCYPIKLVNAFTGTYGSVLVFTTGKGTNVVPVNPERDIYFCLAVVCSETVSGAQSSGWVGSEN